MFGCVDRDTQRKKLYGKNVECVNLGVSEEFKAYNLYEPVEGRVTISMDVMFDEEKCWDWNKKDQVVLEESQVHIYNKSEVQPQENLDVT